MLTPGGRRRSNGFTPAMRLDGLASTESEGDRRIG
jgi:hypothetical protein